MLDMEEGFKRTHTHTHTEKSMQQFVLFFHRNSGYANAPERYVLRTLLVLFADVMLCVSG
jgi:hypothetical protein